MKKALLLFFLFMNSVFLVNAQILNGRFEDWTQVVDGTWTYDSLHYWKTTDLASLQNSTPSVHSVTKETSNVYEGSSSIKLTSWTAGGVVAGLPGAASNGDVLVSISFPVSSVTPIGGVPDVERHGALMGYYQYIPVSGDHGSIETCLFKRNGANRDTIAFGKLDAALNIGTYTHFTIPLTPVSSGIPDSSLIWLQSSPRFPLPSGQTGSVLRVDSLYYSGTIGVNEISPLIKSALTYPVPAVNDINIKVELVSPVSMHYEILDISGKMILSGKMNGTTQKIDISKIATGNYIINLHDDAGVKLISDKFTIVR